MISVKKLKKMVRIYRLASLLTSKHSKKRRKLVEKKERARNLIELVKVKKGIAIELESISRRSQDVIDCPDIDRLERCENAGKIIGTDQIMHNGLKVGVGTYYHEAFHYDLMKKGRGVHEPQEEIVFNEVLKHIQPNSTMVELGSYWAYYSAWFKSKIKGARTVMFEPNVLNLNLGRLNYSLNNLQGEFIHGFVGDRPLGSPKAPTWTIDDLMVEKSIPQIHLLHSDIQGSEYKMLQSTKEAMKNRSIDYVMVSTHSPLLHKRCLNFLKNNNYFIIAEHTPAESYSVDGLIAARRSELEGLGEVKISKKKPL